MGGRGGGVDCLTEGGVPAGYRERNSKTGIYKGGSRRVDIFKWKTVHGRP